MTKNSRQNAFDLGATTKVTRKSPSTATFKPTTKAIVSKTSTESSSVRDTTTTAFAALDSGLYT